MSKTKLTKTEIKTREMILTAAENPNIGFQLENSIVAYLGEIEESQIQDEEFYLVCVEKLASPFVIFKLKRGKQNDSDNYPPAGKYFN